MSLIDWSRLAARANADGEFRLQARFWNASIRVDTGDGVVRIAIGDGRIAAVEPWGGRIASDLAISASTDAWAELLAPMPKPFYHDLAAAAVHHDVSFSGDVRHRCAYYPAVRRLVELMREVRNDQ